MSEPLELKEFAIGALTHDLEIYARRADQAQRKFLRGIKVTALPDPTKSSTPPGGARRRR